VLLHHIQTQSSAPCEVPGGIDFVRGFAPSPYIDIKFPNGSWEYVACADICRQKAISSNGTYIAWGFRNENQTISSFRRTCFLFPKGFKSYRGNAIDFIHSTGCLRPGEDIYYGCEQPPAIQNETCALPMDIQVVRGIWDIRYGYAMNPVYGNGGLEKVACAETCRQKALSSNGSYVAWAFRNDNQTDPYLRNTCALFSKGVVKSHRGNANDFMHSMGCLRPGEDTYYGCEQPPAIPNETCGLPSNIDVKGGFLVHGWRQPLYLANLGLEKVACADACRQRALGSNGTYIAWIFKNENHMDPYMRNTCELYLPGSGGFKSFRGSTTDTVHLTGCLRPGEDLYYGCEQPPAPITTPCALSSDIDVVRGKSSASAVNVLLINGGLEKVACAETCRQKALSSNGTYVAWGFINENHM
jgi:hypothetical protein